MTITSAIAESSPIKVLDFGIYDAHGVVRTFADPTSTLGKRTESADDRIVKSTS
jgi:hypothetical protein